MFIWSSSQSSLEKQWNVFLANFILSDWQNFFALIGVVEQLLQVNAGCSSLPSRSKVCIHVLTSIQLWCVVWSLVDPKTINLDVVRFEIVLMTTNLWEVCLAKSLIVTVQRQFYFLACFCCFFHHWCFVACMLCWDTCKGNQGELLLKWDIMLAKMDLIKSCDTLHAMFMLFFHFFCQLQTCNTWHVSRCHCFEIWWHCGSFKSPSICKMIFFHSMCWRMDEIDVCRMVSRGRRSNWHAIYRVYSMLYTDSQLRLKFLFSSGQWPNESHRG